MIVRRLGDWVTATAGTELIMMSVEKGSYVGLGGVGARVWELIETPQPVDAIYAQLEKEFDVTPEICRTEVDAFLAELVKQNAVVLDPG